MEAIQNVFKLKGLDYYIVGAENIKMAAIFCIINKIGVTDNDIEEVTDKSTLPQEPDKIISLSVVDKHLLYQDIRNSHVK